MSTVPQAQQAPPGWYPDPYQQGQRWWDGVQWTAFVAPYAAPPAEPKKARTGDWVGGILLSLLIPLVGLIAGIVYAIMGGERRAVGFTCIGISLAMWAFYAIAIAGGS
jgi:predicted lipid-binding transport protein (Tim44 family)